jgi:hypothetical protein
MYAFVFEKPFRLAGRTFGLAMASGSSPNYAVAVFQTLDIPSPLKNRSALQDGFLA